MHSWTASINIIYDFQRRIRREYLLTQRASRCIYPHLAFRGSWTIQSIPGRSISPWPQVSNQVHFAQSILRPRDQISTRTLPKSLTSPVMAGVPQFRRCILLEAWCLCDYHGHHQHPTLKSQNRYFHQNPVQTPPTHHFLRRLFLDVDSHPHLQG